MVPEQDREVRKNSIASIATIAQRANDRKEHIESPALVNDLIAATSDSDSVIRDTATFALGLIADPASRERLTVLLNNGDANTRVNAAVGLARQKSTAGFPVFKQVLAADAKQPAEPVATRELESLLAVKNSLHAIRLLAEDWTPAQRAELVSLVDPISKNDLEPRIRTDATDVLLALRKN